MARVTVEDCLDFVENRFKLVLLASKRARQISLGTEPLVEWENDKPTVVALREIEQGLVNEEMMQASLAEPVEEEKEFDEDDLAAALHAEISRELSQTAPETNDEQAPKAPEPIPATDTTTENQAFPATSFTPESEQTSATNPFIREEAVGETPSPSDPPAIDNSPEEEQGS